MYMEKVSTSRVYVMVSSQAARKCPENQNNGLIICNTFGTFPFYILSSLASVRLHSFHYFLNIRNISYCSDRPLIRLKVDGARRSQGYVCYSLPFHRPAKGRVGAKRRQLPGGLPHRLRRACWQSRCSLWVGLGKVKR